MKPKLLLKSLADLPANVLELAASIPGRAAHATQAAFAPPVRATRRQIREARRRSRELADALLARTVTPVRSFQPWARGGINE